MWFTDLYTSNSLAWIRGQMLRRRQRARYSPAGVRSLRSRCRATVFTSRRTQQKTSSPKTGTEASETHPRCHPCWPLYSDPLCEYGTAIKLSDIPLPCNGGVPGAAYLGTARSEHNSRIHSLPALLPAFQHSAGSLQPAFGVTRSDQRRIAIRLPRYYPFGGYSVNTTSQASIRRTGSATGTSPPITWSTQ